MEGQPGPQWYFTRTLGDPIGTFFAQSMTMDGIEEPSFPPALEGSRLFDWQAFPEISPVLAAHLRVAGPS
jgi:hypothetical protein